MDHDQLRARHAAAVQAHFRRLADDYHGALPALLDDLGAIAGEHAAAPVVVPPPDGAATFTRDIVPEPPAAAAKPAPRPRTAPRTGAGKAGTAARRTAPRRGGA